MKAILIVLSFAIASMSFAIEEMAAKAASGRFKVTQEYHGDCIATIRFRDPKFPAIPFSGMPWPGIYSISPDEHWLLRDQKTGSGDSVAILYRVEENGRVSEVLGFDDLLWGVSDMASRLKRAELYHTGITEYNWSGDSSSLEIIIRGSNASKSGDGIECKIVYDLKANRAAIKPAHGNEGVRKTTAGAESK